jgi:two-component system LytT family response regulator
MLLRDGERCWFVALVQISRMEVDGNRARVHSAANARRARGMDSLESRLDPGPFLRANRTALVNLRMVESIDPSVGDGYALTLGDGADVEVSRRQARELRERLSL